METQNGVSKKQKIGKIVSYVINIVSIVIMFFAVFIVITSLTSKDRGYTVYFGKAYVTVSSDSMKWDHDTHEVKKDNFKKGDVICFNVISDKQKENLEVGTVITFWDYEIASERQLNTHRIVAKEVEHHADGDVIFYVTQGDNNGVPDTTRRRASDVQGTYAGKSVVLGQALTYLQSKEGFAIFIVVPCVLIMIYCAVLVIMNLMKYTREKAVLQHEDNVDVLKAQLKEQLLKELAEKEGVKAETENADEKKEDVKENIETQADNADDAQESAEQEQKEEVNADVAEEQPKQDETKTDKE